MTNNDDLDARIERIKTSIRRIGLLMQELKTINEEPKPKEKLGENVISLQEFKRKANVVKEHNNRLLKTNKYRR